MFVSLQFLSEVLYELTLFILFSALTYSMIKSYVLPAIYGYISQAKKQRKGLKNKSKLVDTTILSVENQIKKQENTLATLEKGVKLWHDSLTEEEESNVILNKKLAEQVRKKRLVQEKLLHIEKVKKEAVPLAINLAQKEFIKHSQKDGREILTKLILSLEQKVSQ